MLNGVNVTFTEVFRKVIQKWKILCLILLFWIYGYLYLLTPGDNTPSLKTENITVKPSWIADVYWTQKFKRLEALTNRTLLGPGKTFLCNII